MASPVFHGLAGAGLAYALAGDSRLPLFASLRRAGKLLAVGAVLACLPDVDYLPGLARGYLNTAHQQITHGAAWTTLVAAGLWLAGRAWKPAWFGGRAAAFLLLVVGSHLAIDLVTAARLAPNDSQRIGRALEVWHITGQAISRLHQHSSAQQPPQPPALLISLEPESRAWLHQRIEQRFDAMLAAGFIDEIHTLRQRGDLHADLPSIRCVGYRQAWLALDAGTPIPIWRDQAIAATRQLAKRQLTWLRSMPTRHTIACDGASPIAQVLQAANKLLAKQPC